MRGEDSSSVKEGLKNTSKEIEQEERGKTKQNKE